MQMILKNAKIRFKGTSKNSYSLSDIADMLIQGEIMQELLVAFAIPFGYK